MNPNLDMPVGAKHFDIGGGSNQLRSLRVATNCDNSIFMKQYVIDELRPEDYKALKKYLDEQFGPAEMDRIYWIPVETDLLTDTQLQHKDCRPHYLALDLDPGRLACELLVRTKNRMSCDCIHYATEKQRNWLIELVDNMFKRLEIAS